MKGDLAICRLIILDSGENVATMLDIKLDFYCCDNSVSFCKSSHIYVKIIKIFNLSIIFIKILEVCSNDH